jgi:hypothetical protein
MDMKLLRSTKEKTSWDKMWNYIFLEMLESKIC